MKTIDLTYDNIKYLALKTTLKLAKHDGLVPVKSGNWFAYPAQNEEVKRFTKKAKDDLRFRQLRGTSYEGDLGKVVIGGKTFFYFPKSKALIREDFAAWCDTHADQWIKKDGGEKQPSTPLHIEELAPQAAGRMYLDVKDRVKRLPEATGLLREENFNTLYDMAKTANDYNHETQMDFKDGKKYFAVTHIQANLLNAIIAYRERKYKTAVEVFLDVAANAVQAAEWICNNHSK